MNGNSTPDVTENAAHSETEKILLQIWSEVLNTADIGFHDDFLGLGGDSLAAMRCINRISAMFGVEIRLDLFLLESTHIAQVAQEITRMRMESAQIAVPENG